MFLYTIFLDKAENNKFSNEQNKLLITIPKKFVFLGNKSEVDLKIENNDILKNIILLISRRYRKRPTLPALIIQFMTVHYGMKI